jgi:hypothetical protein
MKEKKKIKKIENPTTGKLFGSLNHHYLVNTAQF